jgi:hypothetical protein
MNAKSSSRGQVVPGVAVALGAIAVVAIAFVALVSRPAAPAGSGSSPSAPPVVATPKPSAPGAPATPAPTSPAKPSPSAAPAVPSAIDLESASGHKVRLSIEDPFDRLVAVASGHPGDGMSVRWYDSIVKQVGANAVEITWVAFPDDLAPGLGVLDLDGELSVAIVQRAPYPNTDALGEDRVVVVTFDRPVDAKTLDVKIVQDMVH